MKRKTSILINIASLCLCIGALVVGVISAKTVTASLSGSIGFKAYNCDVDITGTITGAVLSNASTNKVSALPTLYLHPTGNPDDSNTNTTISIDGNSQTTYNSISFGNLGFAVDSTTFAPHDITMTFSITNKSEFAVCASLSLEELNVDPSITFSANEYKLKLGDKNSETKTSEFKVTIKAGSTSVNATRDASKINFTFEKFNVPTADDARFLIQEFYPGEYCISGVPSGSGTLTIPAYFSDENDKLVRIEGLWNEGNCLKNIEGYNLIILSEGYTCVGETNNQHAGCFYDTSGVNLALSTIVLPCSVTAIYGNAFRGCSNLNSIIIPQNVTIIGSDAFSECTGLTSITIPSSVTSIESYAFSGCTGLSNIVVEFGNTIYDSRDNCNAIIKTATNELVVGCKNTNFPNDVTGIGDYAFYGCSSLTSITIPNSVTSIGVSTFSDCTGLTSITIPSSVTSIGKYAFYVCTGLTSITIPSSVTSIGWGAFSGCTGLTSLTFETTKTWQFSYQSSFSNPTDYPITAENNYVTVFISTYTNRYWRVKPAG